jgi:hypothetical protein
LETRRSQKPRCASIPEMDWLLSIVSTETSLVSVETYCQLFSVPSVSCRDTGFSSWSQTRSNAEHIFGLFGARETVSEVFLRESSVSRSNRAESGNLVVGGECEASAVRFQTTLFVFERFCRSLRRKPRFIDDSELSHSRRSILSARSYVIHWPSKCIAASPNRAPN